MSDFDQGGWLPSGTAEVTIGVDECIVRPSDALARRLVCVRTDEAHLKAAHPERVASADGDQ